MSRSIGFASARRSIQVADLAHHVRLTENDAGMIVKDLAERVLIEAQSETMSA